jgi:hypothetical protein
VAVAGFESGLRWNMLYALPIVLLLAWARCWPWVKLILFPLPLAIPALVVFSGAGMTYYTLSHVVAGALLLSVLVAGAHRLVTDRSVLRRVWQRASQRWKGGWKSARAT